MKGLTYVGELSVEFYYYFWPILLITLFQLFRQVRGEMFSKEPFTQAKISTNLSSIWLLRQKNYNLYLKNGPARA